MPYSTESIAQRPPENQALDASLLVSDMRNSRVPLAMTFEELLGTDNAPDETADELMLAVRQGRDALSDGRVG